ncbi:S8 family peptidase [Croceiramulus getboli]|nr:S8/S53 family peptidase [Flavobacteriaceae bacterium YJPT1-3]
MKKLLMCSIALTMLLFSCSKEEIVTPQSEAVPELEDAFQKVLSIEEINTYIDEQFQTTGSFDWTQATNQVLYSAVYHGNKILTVGYGSKGASFEKAGDQESPRAKQEVLQLIQETEGTVEKSERFYEDDILNYMDVEVNSLQTIEQLRGRDDIIRYLEPNGYSFYQRGASYDVPLPKSSKGCNKDNQTIAAPDYRNVAPGAQVSWTFDQHNITQAWNYSTGAGVTVGVIDTGISSSQYLLSNAGFNDGYSSNRTVQRYGTFIDSSWWWSNNLDGPHDKCGHGTSMASTMTSPRNNDNLPVGVAYNSNLVSYRGTEDVVLDDYHERKGVSNALKALANRSDVKIISMSIGYPWSIGNVKDAVRYAHSRGKLIFAAGGTSTSITNWYGVIFPASMSETVAVTGITDNGRYDRCDVCHSGSKIDFTVVMQREGDGDRTAPVAGFYSGNRQYVGGSSVATATTAGIAALVWARYPSWSRDQVLSKLRQAAAFYPNKSSDYGYGNIDALKAVQ